MDDFFMSPMSARGEERLRRARACIKKAFAPGGPGRCPKRALEAPTAAPAPAKTPRTKLRQRIRQAAQLSTEDLFSQQFGSCEELMQEEFDLARPAPKPSDMQQRPISHFSFGAAPAFTSSLPAPSTANVSQLTRPSRVRTPRKAAVKRGRAGESSAEKALPVRKPRLGGFAARSIDYASAGASFDAAKASFNAAKPAFGAADLRRNLSFVTKRDQLAPPASYSSKFLSRTSPSKFQFSSNATRLFSQRQAPLR